MITCVTHHYACECREAAVREAVALLRELYSTGCDPDEDECDWCRRTKEVLEILGVR